MRWWQIGLGVVAGLALTWLALGAALFAARPRDAVGAAQGGAGGARRGAALREVLRLLPDALRLVGRLAADRSLPAGVRVRLALLGVYLAVPFDLVPDFVPVIGYADDAIVLSWTLRAVTRRAGLEAVRRHWPGTDDGFAALVRLCRLDRPTRTRLSWWVDAGLVAGFTGLTLALAHGHLLDLDLAVRDWSDAHRPYVAELAAHGLNYVGQGSPLAVISLGIAIWLSRRRHSIRPVLPVVVAYLGLGFFVGPFKKYLDRAAPHNYDVAHPERFFSYPDGLSYPSGHVANTVVWYTILILLLGGLLSARWQRILWLAPPAIVVVMTVYLGYHWVTDSIAGLLLGLLLARLLRRVPWDDLPLPLGRRLTAAGWARPALDPSLDSRAGPRGDPRAGQGPDPQPDT